MIELWSHIKEEDLTRDKLEGTVPDNSADDAYAVAVAHARKILKSDERIDHVSIEWGDKNKKKRQRREIRRGEQALF